jgi:hypothetical protein
MTNHTLLILVRPPSQAHKALSPLTVFIITSNTHSSGLIPSIRPMADHTVLIVAGPGPKPIRLLVLFGFSPSVIAPFAHPMRIIRTIGLMANHASLVFERPLTCFADSSFPFPLLFIAFGAPSMGKMSILCPMTNHTLIIERSPSDFLLLQETLLRDLLLMILLFITRLTQASSPIGSIGLMAHDTTLILARPLAWL